MGEVRRWQRSLAQNQKRKSSSKSRDYRVGFYCGDEEVDVRVVRGPQVRSQEAQGQTPSLPGLRPRWPVGIPDTSSQARRRWDAGQCAEEGARLAATSVPRFALKALLVMTLEVLSVPGNRVSGSLQITTRRKDPPLQEMKPKVRVRHPLWLRQS